MKPNIRKIRKSRIYSDDFKRSLVSLFESGQYSVLQLEKLYGVRCTQIYNWIYKFSEFNEKGSRIVEMKESNQNKLNELQNRLKELEQIVGQKQITIDYLEKMIDLAKEEFKIDIKKNYNLSQSVGSNQTKKR
jgi:transposase